MATAQLWRPQRILDSKCCILYSGVLVHVLDDKSGDGVVGGSLKWWEAYEWLEVMRLETNTRVIEYQKYYERLEVMRVENTRMIEYHYFVNHCSWLKVQKVTRERLEPRGSVDGELRRSQKVQKVSRECLEPRGSVDELRRLLRSVMNGVKE